MKAGLIVVIGVIVFITPAAPGCEALFFTAARKLHTGSFLPARKAAGRVAGKHRKCLRDWLAKP
jgi:hypothetical protein